MIAECEICRDERPNRTQFNFKRDCCRAHFLCRLSSKAMRRGWIARWRDLEGDGVADRVEAATRELWGRLYGSAA